jgi:Dolichyl-phosphate-mannose-protein mannosyltransferase
MARRRLDWLLRPGPWIAAILIAHAALAVGESLAVPLYEEQDEISHILYVRYIQVYHRLPVQDKNSEGPRSHHPPLFYLAGALLTAWVPVNGSVDAIRPEVNPNFRVVGDDTETDNKAHYVHFTPDERFPYSGLPLLIHVLRLLSLALSTGAVWLTYLTARTVRPGDAPFALLAAALVAFNPDVIIFASVVYNDTAALFGGALVLYTATRAAQRGFSPWRWLWVSAALGVGLLLKLDVLAVGVPVGLLWLWEAWSRRGAGLRALATNALAVSLPFAALTGWWFLRNLRLYGDLTADSAILALWGKPNPVDTSVLKQTLTLLDNPIGRFGTGAWISFPDWAYVAARIVIVVALAGAAVAAARYFRKLRAADAGTSGPRGSTRQVLLAAAADPTARLWVFHLAAILVIEASVVYYAVTVVGWTATRFMYPAFTSIVMLVAAGLLAWVGPRWPGIARAAIALGVGVALLTLELYALFGLIIPIYGPPRAPRAAEMASMTPLDAHIGNVAQVLGYHLDSSHLHSDGVLDVTLYWNPTTRTDVPYSAFVHLFQPGVGSLAQRDTYPGGGNWATTVWDPGRPFVETFHLHVPPDALPVTGGQILVGLYDRNTMARLPVTGRDAVPDQDWIAFGSIDLEP